MNRKIAALMLIGPMVTAMTGCGFRLPTEEPPEFQETTSEATEVTDEITVQTPPPVITDPVEVPAVPTLPPEPEPDADPDFEDLADYEPSSDHRYIYPFDKCAQEVFDTYSYTYRYEHYYCFVDENGEEVCDAIYTFVKKLPDADAYIVGRRDNSGKIWYGILSIDGSRYSGLIYDGYYDVPGKSSDDRGCTFLSRYKDDVICVSRYDDQAQLIYDGVEVPVGADIDLYSCTCIYVRKIYEGRAVITVQKVAGNWFDEDTYLVDTATGRALYAFEDGCDYEFFGDLIVVHKMFSSDEVRDLNGGYAYSSCYYATRITEDRLVMADTDEVIIVDGSENVIASLPVDGEYNILVGVGKIMIEQDGHTSIYDREFNLLMSIDDLYIAGGEIIDDPDDFIDTDIVFIDEHDQYNITNLTTGATMTRHLDHKYWYVDGYIVADNSLGTSNTSEYSVFNGDLERIIFESGTAEYYKDSVTGAEYMITWHYGAYTLYEFGDDSMIEHCELTPLEYCRDFVIIDGEISFNNCNECILESLDGTVIVMSEVECI